MLKIILVQLMTVSAFGQNVTASFDHAAIGENPASAATREFGIISPIVSMSKTEQKVKDPFTTTVDLNWKREITVQKYELIATGKANKYVPEASISYNKAKVGVSADDESSDTKQEISFVNGQLNLGINLDKTWKMGFIFFYPKVKYNGRATYTQGTNVRTNSYSINEEVRGTGIGVTSFVTKSFAVGAFFTLISEVAKNTGSTKVNNDPTESYEDSRDGSHKKYGFGMSYQTGSSKGGGFRLELSHIRMDWEKLPQEQGVEKADDGIFKDSQNQIAMEASTLGLVGGVTVTQTYGRYVNYKNYLDYIVAETGSHSKPITTYGGFLGFKTRGGSSLGGFVTYYKGKSNVAFLGADATAGVKQYGGGLNYSYSF